MTIKLAQTFAGECIETALYFLAVAVIVLDATLLSFAFNVPR